MRLPQPALYIGAAVLLCAICFQPAAAAAKTSAAPQAAGQNYTHEAGGITFVAPAGWKAEEEDGQMTVSAPDGSISVVFWVTEEEDFEAASEALGEEIAKQVKNAKLDGEPKEGTHNGMPYASITGSGQIEGDDIAFSADMLQAKKPVIILTFASPENFEKHRAAYAKLIQSIKRVG